MAEQYIT